jgi:hypothetical protein
MAPLSTACCTALGVLQLMLLGVLQQMLPMTLAACSCAPAAAELSSLTSAGMSGPAMASPRCLWLWSQASLRTSCPGAPPKPPAMVRSSAGGTGGAVGSAPGFSRSGPCPCPVPACSNTSVPQCKVGPDVRCTGPLVGRRAGAVAPAQPILDAGPAVGDAAGAQHHGVVIELAADRAAQARRQGNAGRCHASRCRFGSGSRGLIWLPGLQVCIKRHCKDTA